jgi:PAS domain S-box-containing protein
MRTKTHSTTPNKRAGQATHRKKTRSQSAAGPGKAPRAGRSQTGTQREQQCNQLEQALRELAGERRALDAIRQSHEDLEQKVQQRTDELTRANELLKRIFSGIAVHIAYLDHDLRYISVNRAYAEAEGHPAEYFTGRSYLDFPEHQESRDLLLRVIETGKPATVYEKPFVARRQPDGAATYWDWNVQPVKDPDRSVSGLLLTSVNVTDRKRAEENNIRLAAAVESAADAVVISDVRGFITYVNPAFEKITGYSRQDAMGRDQHMLDGGKHDQAFFEDLRTTIRREGFWKGRLLNRKKDGTIYNEECTYSPIRNADGEIINYVSIKRDVTEKLWLESIAQSVETMNNIGYIFAGVRHEIGNPVNAVTMILEVLRSKLASLDKKAMEGYLDRALSELSRVGYLLRTLKTYNMYERPRLQQLGMRRFLEQFLSVVQEDFRDRGITMTTSIEPDAETCQADPRALQQVLLNFLTNAVDALQGREDPVIALRVLKRDGMIHIQVEDNGCGMTEEEQRALFKPFYTTKAKGTGLGLVIVKKMLTTMHGTIRISSTKNSGTVVNVTLPDGSPDHETEHHFSERGQRA